MPTDLWTEGGVSELNLMQLEGQARATTRAIAAQAATNSAEARDWVAGGISATHHTAGLDRRGNQVRRAICWNDQTLAKYHAKGLERLGGPDAVKKLIGGPWAVRYSLSHLVKDEETLPEEAWKQTAFISAARPAGRRLPDRTVRRDAASRRPPRPASWTCERTGGARRCSTASRSRSIASWPGSSCRGSIQDMNEPVGPLSESVADVGSRAAKPGHRAAGLPDPRRPGGRPGRRRGRGRRAGGDHPRQLGGGELVGRDCAAVGLARRDAAQLGPVPVDALLQQRRPVPRPRRRPEAGLGRAGAGRPQGPAGMQRHRGAAVRPVRAVARRERAAVPVAAQRADRSGRAVPGGAGSAGVPDRPGGAGARGGRAEDHADHRVRRHRPQR